MHFSSVDEFLTKGNDALAKGPIALIFAEDEVEVVTTLRHHLDVGFSTLVLFALPGITVPADLAIKIYHVEATQINIGFLQSCVNRVIAAAPGQWLYYCFNAEYLFFPFVETRRVGEMLAFHTEERREAMISYIVDLYAENLTDHPNAVCLQTAHMDKTGYYALARTDAANNWAPKDRQLDFYGGLRWRFEEFVPHGRRRIDRVALFRAKPGLRLREDFTLSDEEMNTYACPWHHNLTTAIVSFRTAKALRANPGSRFAINTYLWQNSVPFEWHSQQLLNMGLMEPGQWF